MKKQEFNREFANSLAFRRKCELFDVTPTTRQASKYRNGKGLLFKLEHGLLPTVTTTPIIKPFLEWCKKRGVNPTKYQRKRYNLSCHD